MIGKRVLAALAAVVFGAGLMVSPALAKCGKDCKHAIISEFHMCKAACPPTHKAACAKACRTEKNGDLKSCKAATNPTPPGCGEASPSGAFLDVSLN